MKHIVMNCILPLILALAACGSVKGPLPRNPEGLPPLPPEIPAAPKAGPPGFAAPPPGEEVPEPEREVPAPEFAEVWAYVLTGREQALREGLPISDLGYFGAEVDSYGKLVSVPDPRELPPLGARVHLVVTCDSYSLTHFVLKPNSPERRELVADLLGAARNFDGLQIDFENIPVRDREPFFSFLGELRAGLKGRYFTAALRARIGPLANDVHDYGRISPLVDRVLVMAYDEHWGGSAPGPIAGMDWCRDVAAYALSVIGEEKLIMGLPLYGRVWIDPSPARAYTHPQIETLLSENQAGGIQRDQGIPNFEYEVPVLARGYYEDAVSVGTRLRMYRDLGVRAVGFWRLGQEGPGVWDTLGLNTSATE